MTVPYAILELFPDAESLPGSQYLARCPLHPSWLPPHILIFDADCWLQGCSSGACDRGDIFSAAMLRRVKAA